MATWIRADLSFASFYSYRIPGLSPSFALSSPVPGPAAIRLALVDAAIQHTGDVTFGRQIFEAVKEARLEVEPPDRVCVLKFFIKRLKPREGALIKSTGIREYCHFEGVLRVCLQVATMVEGIAGAFLWLRRLGTTDSLLLCQEVATQEEGPPLERTWKESLELPPTLGNFSQRLTVTLNDLVENVTFDQINPYAGGRRGNPYRQKVFLLPLVPIDRGENWTLYRKQPFEL